MLIGSPFGRAREIQILDFDQAGPPIFGSHISLVIKRSLNRFHIINWCGLSSKLVISNGICIVVLKRTFLYSVNCRNNLLGAGVLGDGLGAFRDGVFGQFSGEEEPDGGLDLPGGDGGPLVVVGQFGSLGSDTLEEIVDERVHDAHGLG